MGSLRLWDDVEQHLVGLDNVYFDTACCATWGLDKKQAEKIILKHPPENTLFGSDCPWEDVNISINFVESLSISDDLKEKIFYKNAMRLLGI